MRQRVNMQLNSARGLRNIRLIKESREGLGIKDNCGTFRSISPSRNTGSQIRAIYDPNINTMPSCFVTRKPRSTDFYRRSTKRKMVSRFIAVVSFFLFGIRPISNTAHRMTIYEFVNNCIHHLWSVIQWLFNYSLPISELI
jgi:hypothetical protein